MNNNPADNSQLPSDASIRQGEKIGYGKPPRGHQFKPGQSGNPKGRPKGVKNESTMLHDLLFKKIDVREAGRLRKITVLEAILRRIAEESLKGNTKSAAFLLGRLGAISATDTKQNELNADEENALSAYLRKMASQIRNDREGDDEPS
jgi:hypothetical protein